MHRINIAFTVAQLLWVAFWLASMIWAYSTTRGDALGQSIRAEVTNFRLHTASVLAMLYILCDPTQEERRWKALVPLFAGQIVIGTFALVEVAAFSMGLATRNALWNFTVYAVGVFQLVVLSVALIFYSVQWIREAMHKAHPKESQKKRAKTKTILFY